MKKNTPNVLLVGDSPVRLSKLQTALALPEGQVSRASSLNELIALCAQPHAVVALDVAADHLPAMLLVLRQCANHARVPVFVRSKRLTQESLPAGLLPTLRAMPCRLNELTHLVRAQLNVTGTTDHQAAKSFL